MHDLTRERPLRHLRRATSQKPEGGFTLVEVLMSLVILSMVMSVVSVVSFRGTQLIADQATERHVDTTSAQFASIAFARDVRGAARTTATSCGGPSFGNALVTLVSSDTGSLVSYRDRVVDDLHELVRTTCSPAGTLAGSGVVVDDLSGSPSVQCSPVSCDASPPPRVVTMTVTRSDRFSFALDGARRQTSDGSLGPVLPAQLFALGGSNPLSVQGNGDLRVTGNAFINSSSPTAVQMNGGNSRLSVSGDFKILAGGGCSGCSAIKTSPFPPGSFPAALPDPLQYLPAPDETGMAVGSCSAGVCSPGIYESQLSLTSSTTLQPGIYVFHRGVRLSGSASVSGTGVLLFNGCGLNAPAGCADDEGSFRISGQVQMNVTPMSTGRFRGVLLYQSRSNSESVSISGGSQVLSISGVLYAPASEQVALGAGGGGLQLSAVIGRSLRVSGNGTVYVDGT